MKKVNLDKEFENWRWKNDDRLNEEFREAFEFDKFIQEEWEEYQKENGLINKSNEVEE